MLADHLTVRNFEWEDLNSLTNLTNELGYPTTVEQMKIRMEKILQLDNYWTLVATFNREIVGYVGLNQNYFWEQDGNFVRIQALVVSKAHRKLGVGKKLIEAAEHLTRQLGAKLIVLNCGHKEERIGAHQFYPKMGFESKSTGYVKQIN